MTVHTTIELDEADEAQLRAIADHEKLSLEELIRKLVADRLEYDRWFHAVVEEGKAAAARGELVDHDEVFRELRLRMALGPDAATG